MIHRREFVVGVAGLVAARRAAAQSVREIWRVGYLGTASQRALREEAFVQGLRQLGYVEHENLRLEFRLSGGRPDPLESMAAELVRLNVHVIVATNNPAIAAARKATTTIPIVMVIPTDAVEQGFVASLARPGGNTTGMNLPTAEGPVTKSVELLRELVPRLSTLVVLWDPTEPSRRIAVNAAAAAARKLGLAVKILEARTIEDLQSAFTAIPRQHTSGMSVITGSLFFAQRMRIAQLAQGARMPIAAQTPEEVTAGALMAYTVDYRDIYRGAAYFVDKILKGGQPADLPVQQPTKWNFVINLRTAKGLGLTIPPSVLLRADSVIDP